MANQTLLQKMMASQRTARDFCEGQGIRLNGPEGYVHLRAAPNGLQLLLYNRLPEQGDAGIGCLAGSLGLNENQIVCLSQYLNRLIATGD